MPLEWRSGQSLQAGPISSVNLVSPLKDGPLGEKRGMRSGVLGNHNSSDLTFQSQGGELHLVK